MDDGIERLRRWTDQARGVPPAFGRLRCALQEVAPGAVTVRLPLEPELLLPDGSASSAVACLLADFGLAACVISTLPDLRGVSTVALTVDSLALPPTRGALTATCTATPYADGQAQHARGELHDDRGGLVAQVSGWLMPTPAEPAGMQRVGLVQEPPAADLPALLQVPYRPVFELVAREALANAIGSLHGGVLALACSLAAGAALPRTHPLTTSLCFLRPTPPQGSVTVSAEVVRKGRRTAAAHADITDADGRLLVAARVLAATETS